VALTANAMSGQSEMFLSHGFDRFISKPIDSRELDFVLKELIRDKQPPEILEAAQLENYKTVITQEKDLDELKKYFVMDAEDAIIVMENIFEKIDNLDDKDIESYITAVHGIKSALKNIGETKLSEYAFELEKAGEERNFDVVVDKTPVFMKNLKSLVGKLKPMEAGNVAQISHDNILYLKGKLCEFRTASSNFNISAAEMVLNELKQKTWPKEIDDAINEISVYLLHSEFKKALSTVERFINMQNN
jgi:HPt (histidine-containing phosphotransfer) domain-containing protein